MTLLTLRQLREPCVELSSIALRYRSKQTAVKNVLEALVKVHDALRPLGKDEALDPKLAEYVFFPLSTCFNETRTLSPRCIELAVRCLNILVAYGWKQNLPAATGKQLLILLTWIAGGAPGQEDEREVPEELSIVVFECLGQICTQMSRSGAGKQILDQVGSSTIVDQIVYLSLESISGNAFEGVQIAALTALQDAWTGISNRVVLASLLPRTVSTMTKSLQSTTTVRRTARFIISTVNVLRLVLCSLLNDEAVKTDQEQRPQKDHATEQIVLDKAWLKATASQIKLALAQVVRLRINERGDVKEAVASLCLSIIDNCAVNLSESIGLLTETLIVIGSKNTSENDSVRSSLVNLLSSNQIAADVARDSLHSWLTSLPRVMRSSDDRPKQQILRQISYTFRLLSEIGGISDLLDQSLAGTLCDAVRASISPLKSKAIEGINNVQPHSLQVLDIVGNGRSHQFFPIIMDHRSEEESLLELRHLIQDLRATSLNDKLVRSFIQNVPVLHGDTLLSSLWLSLEFLKPTTSTDIVDTFLDFSESSDERAYMVEDLYSAVIPYLDSQGDGPPDWRLMAMTLETINLQASQLGEAFRSEMIDILYPMLSLLGSPIAKLREHATVALNQLSDHLQYSSVSNMLIENVDYLINSVALRLNSVDLSPQGPQVMLMMLQLCGSKIVPYLDDLIGSIFTALDTYHGYPRLVEMMFEVLEGVVNESTKSPQLAIANGTIPDHKQRPFRPSTIVDILSDLRARKKRKARRDSETDPLKLQPHPKRPWSSSLDGPEEVRETSKDQDSQAEEVGEDDSAPLPEDKDTESPLSKPHALLLSIARSTIPHLSSPSPTVRHTCLRLLNRIIPVLSRHENSFLPLLNDIWPGVSDRVFDVLIPSEESDDNDNDNRTSSGSSGGSTYVSIAALETISSLCIAAGDFMNSRIENLYPRLSKLYKTTWQEVEKLRTRQGQRQNRPIPSITTVPNPTQISIRTTTQSPTSLTTSTTTSHPTLLSLHTPLLSLFSTILSYTSLPPETSDLILPLVYPAVFGPLAPNPHILADDDNDDDETAKKARDKSEASNTSGSDIVGNIQGGAGTGTATATTIATSTVSRPSPTTATRKDLEDARTAKKMREALQIWNAEAVWLATRS